MFNQQVKSHVLLEEITMKKTYILDFWAICVHSCLCNNFGQVFISLRMHCAATQLLSCYTQEEGTLGNMGRSAIRLPSFVLQNSPTLPCNATTHI